jgi:hypothetical protein
MKKIGGKRKLEGKTCGSVTKDGGDDYPRWLIILLLFFVLMVWSYNAVAAAQLIM